ncbi:MAG: prepilin-type N-terminal cleavage/methylation domain-containing protein [Lachnospiraceae bacterium]|nr:prepilin-type N-terminal cleavage/methylation domain-containing protein [Lachnospiraceae bacterium]
MKDNRGLTLVELLITVTILALVVAGAATFMLAGSRSFAKGSADSNVQGEAELAVNQIEDLVIDVNGGVDFTDDSDASTLTMYHVEADNSGVAVNKKRTVKWDKHDNNIYSGEWTVEKDGSGVYVETSTIYANQLLAENVMDFNVDLSDKYTETAKDGTDIEIVRSVVIRVDCLDSTGKSTYATTPTITLRNRLMISSNPDEIFKQTPAPDDSLLLYISSTGMEGAVPVRDRVTTVERGKVYNIFVMVNAGTNVNSLCDFTVEGETSGTLSTITPNGVHIALDVNTTEPNDYLKITATYQTNSAKKVSGWVRVVGGNSKSLDGVNIIPVSLTPFKPKYDSHVFGTPDLTLEEREHLQYSWSVSEPERVESFKSTEKTLELSIIKNKENYGKVLTITLVVYSPDRNQTVSDSVTYVIDDGMTTGGDSLMERGKGTVDDPGYHGDNWYWFNPPEKKGDANKCEIVGAEYYVCDAYGNRISSKDYLTQYVIIELNKGVTSPIWGGNNVTYWLTIDKNLPADQEFWLKVVVNFKYADGTEWSYSRLHFVSAVHLFGESTTSYGNMYSGFEFYYKLIGYYSLTWAKMKPDVFVYDIDLDYDAPAGVTVEPKFYEWSATEGNLDRDPSGKTIKGSAGFNVINESGKEMWQIQNDIKIKHATIKVYMKDYPSVYTYCYVDFK